jgi:hypothetical protein
MHNPNFNNLAVIHVSMFTYFSILTYYVTIFFWASKFDYIAKNAFIKLFIVWITII